MKIKINSLITPFIDTLPRFSWSLPSFAEQVAYTLTLDSAADIRNLFMMTPYAYRTAPADREKVLLLDNLQTDAHFIILVYRKEK